MPYPRVTLMITPTAAVLKTLSTALCIFLGLAAIASAADSSQEKFYPIERLEFFVDGEDIMPNGEEPDVHGRPENLYIGFIKIKADTDGISRRTAGAVVVSSPSGEEDARTISPPLGRWDYENTYFASRNGVIILTATDGDR